MKQPWERLLHEPLLEVAAREPEGLALVTGGQEYLYGDLLRQIESLARGLRSRGLEAGDRVLVYLENGVAAILGIYASLLAGAVFVPVHPQTKAEKLEGLLADSEARFVLSSAAHLETLRACRSKGGSWEGIIDAVSEEEKKGLGPGFVAWRDVLQLGPSLPPASRGPEDLAALIYTSGSSGIPKGVMLTHAAMSFAARSVSSYLSLSSTDRILCVLPLSFDYGLYQALMAFQEGATLVLESGFVFPGPILEKLGGERITVFPGVPTIFAMLLSATRRASFAFPGVRCVTNTAAALPEQFLPELERLFPKAAIFKMYGLTECKRVSYLDPADLHAKPGSVGKAIPGTEVLVLNPSGQAVRPGEVGTLFVRGPHLMRGYWKQEARSKEMLVEDRGPGAIAGRRILCTQDQFRVDEEGFLYFVGRSDDVIKSRGEKVSPREVERAVERIPGVKLAAVLGVPDALLGEAICAYVVPDGTVELSVHELQRAAQELLEPALVPTLVRIVDVLPRTPNGKVDKAALLRRSETDRG